MEHLSRFSCPISPSWEHCFWLTDKCWDVFLWLPWNITDWVVCKRIKVVRAWIWSAFPKACVLKPGPLLVEPIFVTRLNGENSAPPTGLTPWLSPNVVTLLEGGNKKKAGLAGGSRSLGACLWRVSYPSSFCSFMHVCVCTFTYGQVHMLMCMHICGGQRATSCVIPQVLSIFLFVLRQSLLVSWNSPNSLGWVTSQFQESTCLCL